VHFVGSYLLRLNNHRYFKRYEYQITFNQQINPLALTNNTKNTRKAINRGKNNRQPATD